MLKASFLLFAGLRLRYFINYLFYFRILYFIFLHLVAVNHYFFQTVLLIFHNG